MLNICILQHVPFESAGTILPYFEGKGHQVWVVHCYKPHQLPLVENLDLLVIMGGPMSVHDIKKYSYLVNVKEFIKESIRQNKWVLGICLGAQLVAEALGAEVGPNRTKEIGWYPVWQTPTASRSWLADVLPWQFTCLHWHGDTFEIPEGAVHVAGSHVCENQAFVWNGRVIGLQFHLEFTPESTQKLIDRSRRELAERDGDKGQWIQTGQQMTSDRAMFDAANTIMAGLLAHIESETGFNLHPQLEEDCHPLADFDCAKVLLIKNAQIPWFILVPRGEYRDLDDMPRWRRSRLMEESDEIAELLRVQFGAEKINVAALGNMVSQLHLHVIGRRPDDPCWPKPVWGNLAAESAWAPEKIEQLQRLLSDRPRSVVSDRLPRRSS